MVPFYCKLGQFFQKTRSLCLKKKKNTDNHPSKLDKMIPTNPILFLVNENIISFYLHKNLDRNDGPPSGSCYGNLSNHIENLISLLLQLQMRTKV